MVCSTLKITAIIIDNKVVWCRPWKIMMCLIYSGRMLRSTLGLFFICTYKMYSCLACAFSIFVCNLTSVALGEAHRGYPYISAGNRNFSRL